MISNDKEIISLWLGEESRNHAFAFYNLQAEQIYDEEEDPVQQSCIWKNIDKKNPRMIIFDTIIDRLTAIRQINHKKLLKKMQKSQISMFDQYYFQVDANPLKNKEQQQEQEGKWDLFQNWTDTQDNYTLIDVNFNWGKEIKVYETWKEFYNLKRQVYENKLRVQLEKCDYLRCFTFCSDNQISAFTTCMIQYLRDQCPKKQYIYSSVGKELSFSSLVDIYSEIDMFIPITSQPEFPYFTQKAGQSMSMAPYFNSIYSPFMMKEVNPHQYMQSVLMGNRKIFNSAYCLPIIDKNLELHQSTNIFSYSKVQENKSEQETESRINFTNKQFFQPTKNKKFISQSYVLKGHFNNLQKLFSPKTQSLSMKYLPGILSAASVPSVNYNSFYQGEYGEVVQAYPFHSVLFSHESFGDDLRNQITKLKKSKIFNENQSEERAKVLQIADYFSEQVVDSD